MPELPEVETTRLGLEPYILGRQIHAIRVHNPALRWPVSEKCLNTAVHQTVEVVSRRGKYLLLRCQTGSILIHLGMSGSLRIVKPGEELRKHDHVEVVFTSGPVLRLHDPRRFGAFIWTGQAPHKHKLLRGLGVEPLDDTFNGEYLHAKASNRKSAVKNFIMNSQIVVGVGNIYASEALFRAGVHPNRAAGKISRARMNALALAIKDVLMSAIEQGGTSLRDFVDGHGNPGYFKQKLKVYGRENQPCLQCGVLLKGLRIGQRSTVYCGQCQR